MLWLLLVVAAALGAGYYRWSRRRLHQLAREIPSGLKEYPILGHAYMFMGNSEVLINEISELYSVSRPQGHFYTSKTTSASQEETTDKKKFQKKLSNQMKALQEFGRVSYSQGGLSHFWMANRLFISITDAKAIEVVSKSCLDKDEFTMKFMRTVVGNGSIFAPVNIWHPRRKILSPFFKSKNLKRIVKVFDEQSTVMADLMRSEVGAGDFPIWKYMTTFTFDTICESAVDVKMKSQENPDHWVLHAIDTVTEMVSTRFLQPWMHPDFVYKRLSIYKKFLDYRNKAYDYVDDIVKTKRKEYAAAANGIGKEINKDGVISFLEMTMQTGEENSYSDLELREEAIVLIVAGNDTSAVGSSFTTVMLSRYHDVQEKAYQELKDVFGDSDRPVTPEDLPRLKYLEAVIKESLRLYPPVPVVAREVHNDVVLPSGTTLVNGTSLVLHIWGTHRNPAYWGADAGQFRPERFLEGPLQHPAQFIPFSYSARSCIGATYALMSMKTGLANLLRRYRLLPPANMAAEELTRPLRVRFDVMMKDVDNFTLRVEERNAVK